MDYKYLKLDDHFYQKKKRREDAQHEDNDPVFQENSKVSDFNQHLRGENVKTNEECNPSMKEFPKQENNNLVEDESSESKAPGNDVSLIPHEEILEEWDANPASPENALNFVVDKKQDIVGATRRLLMMKK